MARQQKIAWLIIVAYAFALAAFLAMIPFMGAQKAIPGLALAGLGGFGPLIFRRRRDPTGVQIDERDRLIGRRAALAAAMSSYGVFILGSLGVYFFWQWQGKELVSVHLLPMIVQAAALAFFLAWAVAVVVQYGREGVGADA